MQVLQYAAYLGLDLAGHPERLPLALYARDGRLPSGWTVHLDAEGQTYYHNDMLGTSQHQHPLEAPFLRLYAEIRGGNDGSSAPNMQAPR